MEPHNHSSFFFTLALQSPPLLCPSLLPLTAKYSPLCQQQQSPFFPLAAPFFFEDSTTKHTKRKKRTAGEGGDRTSATRLFYTHGHAVSLLLLLFLFNSRLLLCWLALFFSLLFLLLVPLVNQRGTPWFLFPCPLESPCSPPYVV